MGEKFRCFRVAVPHGRRTAKVADPLPLPPNFHDPKGTIDVICVAVRRKDDLFSLRTSCPPSVHSDAYRWDKNRPRWPLFDVEAVLEAYSILGCAERY